MEILYENECILFSLILGRKKFFFLTNPTFSRSLFFLCMNVNKQEMPHSSRQQGRNPLEVKGQSGRQQEYINIHFLFPNLLWVSLLYRLRYGSFVLTSWPLTTLVALMVACGKLSAVSSFLVCVCVCAHVPHVEPVLVVIDAIDQKEATVREKEDIHIISSWLDWH